jgi:predicted kinase
MIVISPEALREQGPGRPEEDVGEAWAEAHRALRGALADEQVERVLVMVGIPGAGKSTWLASRPHDPSTVAFDAVFADRKRRAAIARRIRGAGKDAIAVWLRTPLHVCLERNATRPAWRMVPEAFLRRVDVQLRLAPPTPLEGWSRVLTVLHGPSGLGILQ